MAHELEDLPLFPLNTVLFPHASLNLHIFEDRYREMVRTCLREDRPFGVVLIREGSETGPSDPYLVGTACRIREVRTYDDGRMDIAVLGERRFRIREIDDSLPYLVGRVEPVIEHEIEEPDRAEILFARARDEFEALIRREIEREEYSVRVVFPTDPVVLSFTIANLLHMENIKKQRMLETTDTVERMEDLMPILEAQILQGGLLGENRQTTYYPLTHEDLQEWVFPN
jgi:Lon protease-like protein